MAPGRREGGRVGESMNDRRRSKIFNYVISDLVFKKLPNVAKFTKFLTLVCNQLILITVKFIYYLNIMFVLI